MTRLKICSLLLVFFLMFGFVVAQDMFGTIQDAEGNEIEPDESFDWGGKSYSLPNDKMEVDYEAGDSGDYSGLSGGDIVFSEYGKIVEAEFDVDSDKSDVIIGNLRLDLKKGSHVTFKDGELSIEDPGEMLDKDDVDFVDDDAAWDDNHLKMSGDGVDFKGLDEVELDEDGYYLRDPDGVPFDDFKVYGKGKVYFFDTGEPNLDIKGAYVSANGEAGKFSIGSNVLGESVSVMPNAENRNAENRYGLKHDIDSDYISFKSIGGAESSYLTVQNRNAEGLTPRVDSVGFFAVDDNTKSVYMGADENIYMMVDGNAVTEFGSPGTTISPVEIAFSKMEGGEVVPLSDYGGVVIFGNDGGVGYGNNPSYVLAGQYGDNSGLYHGASNMLAYNYYAGGPEVIEQIFKFKITGNRRDIVNDPASGKLLMDMMFQMPKGTVDKLTNLEFGSAFYSMGVPIAGRAGPDGHVEFVVGGASSLDQRRINVLAHEAMGHLFSSPGVFNLRGTSEFLSDWQKVGGYDYHAREYWGGRTPRYESISQFAEFVLMPPSFWKEFQGEKRVSLIRKAAVLGKHDGITMYQANSIISSMGGDVSGIRTPQDYDKIINGAV